MAKDATPAAGTFSVEQAAGLLGTSVEELRPLSRRGSIPKITDGMLPQVRTIQAYVAHLRRPVVPVAEAGEQIGVTGTMVRKVIAEGFITPRPEGGVDLIEAFRGYIRFLRDEDRRSSKVAAEAGLKAARQREIEMRIAEKQHRLIDTDEAIAFVDMVVGAYRAEFGGLPARVTRDIALRKKVEAQVNDALKRVAKVFEGGASALRASGEIVDADPEAEP